MNLKVCSSFKEPTVAQTKRVFKSVKRNMLETQELSYESCYEGASAFLDALEISIVKPMPACPRKTSTQLKLLNCNQLWSMRRSKLNVIGQI